MSADVSTITAQWRHAMFARHANPWSAWTRWASTPLVLLPAWTHRWSHAALVGAWLIVNPVVFPKPTDDRAWSTCAILGEELWITRRPRDVGCVVSGAASIAAVAGIVAARRRRLLPAATATGVQMALTLVYWELMARYRQGSVHSADSRWAHDLNTFGPLPN